MNDPSSIDNVRDVALWLILLLILPLFFLAAFLVRNHLDGNGHGHEHKEDQKQNKDGGES